MPSGDEDPLAIFTDVAVSDRYAWISPLAAFITGPVLPDAEHGRVLGELVVAVCGSRPSLLDLLQTLGAYLTIDEDVKRTRAISVLSSVLLAAPDLITTPDHVHHLAEFFTSRLMDWVALQGALQGCDALLRPNSNPSLAVADADAVQMLQTISDGVYVRSLAAKDRSLVFCVIKKLVDSYGRQALEADIDLAELIVVSMDGEKDPGCLLDALHAAQSVLRVFSTLEEGGPGSVHLERIRTAEDEMFDILSCYFPVSFEPREDSARRITRDDLALGLEVTLLLWPGFYGAVLEMVEEKLGSIVKQAKLDSLRMVEGMCGVTAGRDLVGRERRRVWGMIRGEVMRESEGGDVGAGAAVRCLATCLGVAGFEKEVFGDVVLGDCMSSLKEVGSEGNSSTGAGSFERQVALTRSAGAIFAACALAGGSVWRKAVVAYGGEILRAIKGNNTANVCFGLMLTLSLVAGADVHGGSVDNGDGSSKIDDGEDSDNDGAATALEVIQGIQEVSATFADGLTSVEQTQTVQGSFPKKDMSADAYATAATVLLAKMKLCEAIACNSTYACLWENANFSALVRGLARVMLCDHEGLASEARCVLGQVCASGTGKLFGATRVAIDILFEHLGAENAAGDVSARIYMFLAAACREEPSLRPTVLREACARSRSLADLGRGLVILEDTLHASIGNAPAIAEEVAVLASMLERAGAGVEDPARAAIVRIDVNCENIARAAFFISRRMTPKDQSRVAAILDANFSSATLGLVLGLYPEVLLEHPNLLNQLVAHVASSSKDSTSINWHLMSCAVASIVNKTARTRPEAVMEAVDSLVAASRWDVIEDVVNALAKESGGILEEVLKHVMDSKQYGVLRSLVSPVTGSSNTGATWISPESHATVTFLWEQKAYTIAKRCAMEIESGLVIQDGNGVEAKTHAIVHLIAGLPPWLVRTDKAFVNAQLCDLMQSRAAITALMHDHSLEPILRAFAGNGLIALPETLDRIGTILPALLDVILHAHYAGARQAGLECLIKIALDIPYQTIHPHRRAILKAATVACDDNKRAVRATAVSCRELFAT